MAENIADKDLAQELSDAAKERVSGSGSQEPNLEGIETNGGVQVL
jgi:hypothetical protein